jgi:hypothetical protein
MMSAMASKIINLTLYQVGWFSCVLGAAWGYQLSGALFAMLMMVIHLALASSRKTEAFFMLCVCLLGIGIDTVQQALGVLAFKSEPDWPLWLPLWIFIIWAQFASLFHYALYWLNGRYLLASSFGLIGGPLAYWGGVNLGAAGFGEKPLLSILSLALVWALATPALFWLSQAIDSREGRYRKVGGKLLASSTG